MSPLMKNLHRCFSKIKCLPSNPLILEDDDDDTSSTAHVKNTFNSLYDPSLSSSTTTTTTTTDRFSSASGTSSPDISAAFSSPRFFLSSPGPSNSILHSSTLSNSGPNIIPSCSSDGLEHPYHKSLQRQSHDRPCPNPTPTLPTGMVAVRKNSRDPHVDFLKSMVEMVEAREMDGERLKDDDDDDDDEYLRELLVWYLTLNPKPTHKFIFSAFSDLLVSLISSKSTAEIRCRRLSDPVRRRSGVS